MSEILSINFGRADRTYRFGDRVTGWVMVQTSRKEDCRGVRLRRFWRTHGKGNKDEGDVSGTILHRGPLPDGGPHRFEFDFPAPAGPFTYRGHYLNVDHYVEARIDQPFARDPTVREEYLLLPGKPVIPSPILLEEPENPIKGVVSPLGGFIGIAAGIIGLSLILSGSPVGILFLVVGGFFSLPLLKRKADERLGKSASARLTSVVLGPGEEVGVEVKVRPPKPVQLNRAFVELRAQEVCVSGSGSNRRTHRHTVFSGTTSLAGAMMLEGGALELFNGMVRIPESAPPSFKGSANKLVWDVKVRLDIPSWPDWVKKIPLVVWPTKNQLDLGVDTGALAPPEEEIFQELPEARREPGFPDPAPHVTGPPPWLEDASSYQGSEVPQSGEPTPEKVAAEEMEGIEKTGEPPEVEEADEHVLPVETRPGAPQKNDSYPTTAEPELPGLVKAINDAGIFGKKRDLLINDLLGKVFEFDLEVKRVDRSIGIYTEPDYRDGRTVTGVLTGSELEVIVYFPSHRNDEIKAWKPGSVQSVQAEVHDWDRLRKRPEFLARE